MIWWVRKSMEETLIKALSQIFHWRSQPTNVKMRRISLKGTFCSSREDSPTSCQQWIRSRTRARALVLWMPWYWERGWCPAFCLQHASFTQSHVVNPWAPPCLAACVYLIRDPLCLFSGPVTVCLVQAWALNSVREVWPDHCCTAAPLSRIHQSSPGALPDSLYLKDCPSMPFPEGAQNLAQ